MSESVRILLVDDHEIVRGGFRALLQTIEGLTVVGEAENGIQALELVAAVSPDVVITDIGMAPMNGLELISELKKSHADLHTIILSMHDDEQYVRRALEVGVSGYILKDSDCSELESAIHSVVSGELYLTPTISKRLISGFVTPDSPRAELEKLSARQREVLELIVGGSNTKQIARNLSLSPKTVETHRAQLMHKLEIYEVAGLVKFAIRAGLISSEG